MQFLFEEWSNPYILYGEASIAEENCAWCQEAKGANSFAGWQFGWCGRRESCLDMNDVNQRVEVVTIFKSRGNSSDLIFPIKMRWDKREISFSELGLRHPTKKGQRMIHVFDMSDGTNDYRLEFDAEMLTWTLISILSGEGK